jgi:hypothetical protein
MDQYTKGLVLAKIESVYGTDPTPTVIANALITNGMPTYEIVSSPKERNIPVAFFGKTAPVNFGEAMKLTFTTELKHSGTAATASRYGCLFRACNLTETVGASSVTYTPNSTMEGESVTLWFYANTTLHKITGCVGTFQIKLVSQEIVVVEWSFTGLYAGSGHATTVSFPSPTHEAIAPITWKAASFVYNSVSTLIISELTLDIGNEVAKRLSANATYGIDRYFVKDRLSKGSMMIEKVALATLNPFVLWDATTQANIAAVAGASAGNICTLAVTGVTLEAPKYADKENVQMYDLAFSLNPTVTTGNNEIVLTFT